MAGAEPRLHLYATREGLPELRVRKEAAHGRRYVGAFTAVEAARKIEEMARSASSNRGRPRNQPKASAGNVGPTLTGQDESSGHSSTTSGRSPSKPPYRIHVGRTWPRTKRPFDVPARRAESVAWRRTEHPPRCERGG